MLIYVEIERERLKRFILTRTHNASFYAFSLNSGVFQLGCANNANFIVESGYGEKKEQQEKETKEEETEDKEEERAD